MTTVNPTQEKAFKNYHQMPISAKTFVALCEYASTDPRDNDGRTFHQTLKFIKSNRLPKSKIIQWLKDYDVGCDYALIAKIYMPIVQRMAQYKCKTAEHYVN